MPLRCHNRYLLDIYSTVFFSCFDSLCCPETILRHLCISFHVVNAKTRTHCAFHLKYLIFFPNEIGFFPSQTTNTFSLYKELKLHRHHRYIVCFSSSQRAIVAVLVHKNAMQIDLGITLPSDERIHSVCSCVLCVFFFFRR